MIQDGDGNYHLQPFGPEFVSAPCGLNADSVAVPEGAVAWVHTHPFATDDKPPTCPTTRLFGRDIPTTYKSEPSDFDGAAASALALPGYIIDKNKMTKFQGDPASPFKYDILNQYDRCGY